MKDEKLKSTSKIEHASREERFKDERHEVFLRGYYSLLDAEIANLEQRKINTNPNTDKDATE